VIRRSCILVLVAVCIAGATEAAAAPPAKASNIVCGVVGFVSGLAGKACNVATGPASGIIEKLLGGGSSAGSKLKTGAELLAIGAAAFEGARLAMKIVAEAINATTKPQLTSTWFSSTYWRVTAIAALLTLPFLFAAAIQALMRSDMSLLVRAAFGYLPLAALATAIAAPVTMLLLAASDEMSSLVPSAAGSGDHLHEVIAIAGLAVVAHGSPFLLLTIGMLGIGAAVTVWIELAVREAAVYVIVLMLPLMFAAMVWPARRVWATRAVEMLIALILSKFAIVAVLTLGAGAIGHGGVLAAIAGIALLILAAFCPWMLLRLLPMAELAGAAAGSMGGELRTHGKSGLDKSGATGLLSDLHGRTADFLDTIPARLKGDAVDAGEVHRTQGGSYGGGGGAISNPTTNAAAAGGGSSGDGGGGDSGGAVTSAADASNGHTEAPPVGATVSSHGGATASSHGGSGQRLPGLGPIWQAPDNTHRPLTLGDEEYNPAPPPAFETGGGESPEGAEIRDPTPERQPDNEGDEQ
jgi:hypothetical protein